MHGDPGPGRLAQCRPWGRHRSNAGQRGESPCQLVGRLARQRAIRTVLFRAAVEACRAKVEGWYDLWLKSRGAAQKIPTPDEERAWQQ